MEFREWSKLPFIDPATYLAGAREMLRELIPKLQPHVAFALKSRPARKMREDERCAIFCYGMATVSGATIKFSDMERSDYDYILSVLHNGTHSFVPLQMKQLVSESVNANTTLQSEIEKLKKYVDSPNLVVAIHVNRVGVTVLDDLDLSNLKIGELWLFGVSNPEEREWRIIGNLLGTRPSAVTFQLPAA